MKVLNFKSIKYLSACLLGFLTITLIAHPANGQAFLGVTVRDAKTRKYLDLNSKKPIRLSTAEDDSYLIGITSLNSKGLEAQIGGTFYCEGYKNGSILGRGRNGISIATLHGRQGPGAAYNIDFIMPAKTFENRDCNGSGFKTRSGDITITITGLPKNRTYPPTVQLLKFNFGFRP